MQDSVIPLLSNYAGLPFSEQVLHGLHFMLCSFAVITAILPLMSVKGSVEHKFGGAIYLPISFTALALGCLMAWLEASFVLFCFDAFCAYLLLSGWRAMYEKDEPTFFDCVLPAGLLVLSVAVTLHAFMYDEGLRSMSLLGFALNGYYLAWRDAKHLMRRNYWEKYRIFFAETQYGMAPASWLGRHLAGMVGSMLANASVVVLTLLPLSLHWLWPTGLIITGAYIAWREREKKMRVQRVLAPLLHPDFGRKKPPHTNPADDIRRAA